MDDDRLEELFNETEEGGWNVENFERFVRYALEGASEDDELGDHVKSISTYEEVGMLSSNRGVVVNMDDDSEFQITIHQAR
jgi:hypothetical protein